MSVKKVFSFDPTRITYIGDSSDDKPTTGVAFGSYFFCTDERRSYIYGSTGWSLWESFYST